MINHNVNVDQRNAGGVTALMLAAANGDAEMVQLLIEDDARADIRDYHDKSAADWADKKGHSGLAQSLRKYANYNKRSAHSGRRFLSDDTFVHVNYPSWFKHSKLDLQNDLKEALAHGKKGIVLFISAKYCSYCKTFIDHVLSDAAIQKHLRANYDIIPLDMLSSEQIIDTDGVKYKINEFATRVKATYTPTLVFYNAKGWRMLTIVGYYPKAKFARVLEYMKRKDFQNETLSAFFRRTDKKQKTNRTFKMIVDRRIFHGPPYNFDRMNVKSKRPLMVVFERNNCKACVELHRYVLRDSSVRQLMNQFETVQLDLTSDKQHLTSPFGKPLTAKKWYERLSLNYVPAIVFFNEYGHEIMRLDSKALRYRIEGSMQLVLEKAYKKEKQLQRWRRKKAIYSMKTE